MSSGSSIFYVSYYAEEGAWELFSNFVQSELYLEGPLSLSSTSSLILRGKCSDASFVRNLVTYFVGSNVALNHSNKLPYFEYINAADSSLLTMQRDPLKMHLECLLHIFLFKISVSIIYVRSFTNSF